MRSPTPRKLAGVVDAQGKPDFDKWFKMATEEQGLKKEQYLRDSVWPSAALKKLTGGTIQVSNDDLAKSFEANYGERVRCRAIVLGDMRRSQEVWAKARQNPSIDFFGDLAEQYSIEPQSKALRGEVPPIRRNGGQPQLEERGVRDGRRRALGHHPARRQVRDPQVRGPHRAGEGQNRRKSATSSTRTSSKRSCGSR